MKQICASCGYLWESLVKEPKACPRCKARQDYYKREGKGGAEAIQESGKAFEKLGGEKAGEGKPGGLDEGGQGGGSRAGLGGRGGDADAGVGAAGAFRVRSSPATALATKDGDKPSGKAGVVALADEEKARKIARARAVMEAVRKAPALPEPEPEVEAVPEKPDHCAACKSLTKNLAFWKAKALWICGRCWSSNGAGEE